MINSFFSAKLIDYSTIRVFIFSDVKKPENTKIKLVKNDDTVVNLTISRQSFLNGLELYECKTPEPIELGNDYYVSIESFGFSSLNVDDVTSFKTFDTDYYYDGDDLGFTYSKEKTTWKLWAPLASKVVLFVKKDNENFVTYKMEREAKGIYSITLFGDFDGFKYRYQITNNGLTVITTDPYALASTANGHDSVVVDLSKVNVKEYNDLPTYDNYVDAIIYELHVRDFTIDNHTNIEHKGKFLGLTEEKRETNGGHVCGIDYLKLLNITHVQLLPIFDFKTVDELNPDKTYNWGYDPAQFFVPEGSYSTNPNDPYSRIIECKEMIEALHKNGLKVNMDVVYNHVYLFDRSVFESVVPNYYFRKQKNGLLSTASGCGNELDTERPMVRKLVLDSCRHWVQFYNVDGFRFDLMGLIDSDTIKDITKMAREYKKDFMIYGEGWNMDSSLEENKRTTILNSFKLPDVAFFNDSFRDIVRGPNGFGKSNEPGYILGNTEYKEGFKFALLGSCVHYCFNPRFISANQSINYLECHDNQTLFDKIKICYPHMKDNEILAIVRSANIVVAMSFGVPFFHAGQEIGLTKYLQDNTYNKGDKFNKFDWDILDKRYDMVMCLSSVLKFRDTFKKASDSKLIESHNQFINFDNGVLGLAINKILSPDNREYLFIFNPNNVDVSVSLNEYYNIAVAYAGYLKDSQFYTENETLIAHQVEVLVKRL